MTYIYYTYMKLKYIYKYIESIEIHFDYKYIYITTNIY